MTTNKYDSIELLTPMTVFYPINGSADIDTITRPPYQQEREVVMLKYVLKDLKSNWACEGEGFPARKAASIARIVVCGLSSCYANNRL